MTGQPPRSEFTEKRNPSNEGLRTIMGALLRADAQVGPALGVRKHESDHTQQLVRAREILSSLVELNLLVR